MNPDPHPSPPPTARRGTDSERPAGAPERTFELHDAQLSAVLVAQQIDELARVLNYATYARGSRPEYAAEVYEVLGSLSAACSKLPQACGHLTDFLRRQQADGNLRADRGFPYAGRPTLAIEAAAFKLGQAAVAANVTAIAFGRAQEAISGLSHADPDRLSVIRIRPALPASSTHGTTVQGRVVEP